MSVKPVDLDGLHVRVTAPAAAAEHPVIVFSHGYGQSLDGYAPLAEHWAGQGFAVVQPTHLDSRSIGLAPDDPRTPEIWRLRVKDVIRVLDSLGTLQNVVPGTFDRSRIAVAGHSYGAQTAGMLLGARVAGLDDNYRDPRITAGVLLAATGRGGDNLSEFAATHFPFMSPDFSSLDVPTLVVAGDADQSALTATRGPDWFTDAYYDSPGARALLTLRGAEHSLGGITGYGVTETTDENPALVAVIQQVSTAFLKGGALPEVAQALGSLTVKQP
nr:alpha/beta fold hydrolase [Actinoplanes abujensis]